MTIYPNKLTEIIYQASGVKLTTAERIAKKITKAGYKSTEEIAEIIKQSAYALSDKHNREVDEARMGYVQLAEDQSLPPNLWRHTYQEAQLHMIRAGWRKVVLGGNPIPDGWDKNVYNEG